MTKDLLRGEFINSLGQLYILKYGDSDFWFPLETICIETGCLSYDVCGLLDKAFIGDVKLFKNDYGQIFKPDEFYTEWTQK